MLAKADTTKYTRYSKRYIKLIAPAKRLNMGSSFCGRSAYPCDQFRICVSEVVLTVCARCRCLIVWPRDDKTVRLMNAIV